MTKWLRLAAMVGGGLMASGKAPAQASKLAPDLGGVLNSFQPVSVVVQYQAPPTDLDLLDIKLLGGTVERSLTVIPALVIVIAGANLAWLANLRGVVYISPNRAVSGVGRSRGVSPPDSY
jgi:hypothetical protein